MSQTPRSARETGLRAVGRVTTWVAAGGLLGTGIFAGLAARTAPGRSRTGTSGTTTVTTLAPGSSGASSGNGAPTDGGTGSDDGIDDNNGFSNGDQSLQGPVGPPQGFGGPGGGHTTSGGS